MPAFPEFAENGMTLTDEQWAVLEPLIVACRAHAKVPPQHLRRTIGAIFWRHDNGAKSPCCVGGRHGRTGSYPHLGSPDADVLRPSEFKHVVQHVGGDDHLGRLPPICLRA
jgi:hypothetical protein